MISICLPTRARPERFAEMYESILQTAQGTVEVLAVFDADDPTARKYPKGPTYLVGEPGTKQSELWNVAWAAASGDIAHMSSDDLVYRTPGWDLKVAEAFEIWKPDRIGMVYVNDGYPASPTPFFGQKASDTDGQGYVFAANPFVTRPWIEAAGFFTPPYYQSWESDTWVYLLARDISRAQYLHKVSIEHMHPMAGKAEMDETYQSGAWGNQHIRRKGFMTTKSPAMQRIRINQKHALVAAIQSHRLEKHGWG